MSIVTTYDNKRVELVYNQHFFCPTRDVGIIDLDLGPTVLNWKMRLVFNSNEGSIPFETKWEYNVGGVEIQLTLFNWVSPSSTIELKKARLISNGTKSQSFYFKVASAAKSDFSRSVHISIWKVI